MEPFKERVLSENQSMVSETPEQASDRDSAVEIASARCQIKDSDYLILQP